jgi:hypothetical protein
MREVQYMSRRVVSIVMILGLGWCATALAVGEAAAPSLIISPSARAWGMGQSFVAVADDATAMYWNPGGLAFLDGSRISLTHSQLVPSLAPDVYFETLDASREIPAVGTFGLSIIYLTYGSWQETDLQGTVIGEHTSYEFALGGYYALKLSDAAAFGVGLKVVREFLAPRTVSIPKEAAGTSFAGDFGILGKLTSRISYGVAIQNLGPSMSFIEKDQSAPLPRTLRGGLAFKPFVGKEYSTLVSLEGTKALIRMREIFKDFEFRDATLNGGVEFTFANFVAARSGYIYDKDGNIMGWTFGFGIRAPVGGGLNFDYASVPKAEGLERENKFSMNYTF